MRITKKEGIKKETVVIELEHEALLTLRRLLFPDGVALHQFFHYITEQAGTYDERILQLIKECVEYKKRRVLDKKTDKVDPETLYRLIEDELNKK